MAEYRLAFVAISYRSVEEISTTFYERFDGILSERAGQITTAVYVESTDVVATARDVIAELESIDLCIVRVDEDLVDAPEIASRLGMTRQAVNLWAKGKRGDSFPHPIGSPGGKRIWTWGQIGRWLEVKGQLSEPRALDLDEAVLVNALLASRRQAVSSTTSVVAPWLAVQSATLKPHAGHFDTPDYAARYLHEPLVKQ